MIKYEIDMKGRSKLVAMGNTDTLSADVMVLIKRLYDSHKSAGEEVAQAFVQNIVSCLLDEDSPLYQEVKQC